RAGLGLPDHPGRQTPQRVRPLGGTSANAPATRRAEPRRSRLRRRLRRGANQRTNPLGPRRQPAPGRQGNRGANALSPGGRKRLAAALRVDQDPGALAAGTLSTRLMLDGAPKTEERPATAAGRLLWGRVGAQMEGDWPTHEPDAG